MSARNPVLAAAILVVAVHLAAPIALLAAPPKAPPGRNKPTTTTSTTTSTSRTTSTTSTSTSSTSTSSTSSTSSSSTSTSATSSSSSSSTSSSSTSATSSSSTSSSSTSATSSSSTSSSSTSTTLPGCLDGTGPRLTITGTWSTAFDDRSLLDGTRLDARAATFLPSPTNPYPVNLGGGSLVCLSGGAALGQYDRTLGWDEMHTMNNAGVRFENPDFTLENTRIDDVTDGIRPIAGPFTIRGAWLSYVRDDCIENDHVQSGLVADSLFDGCYVGISERPSQAIIDSGYDGRSGLLTIRNSLVRLEPMPGPRGGLPTDYGNGQFFKWSNLATPLELYDDVFMAEQVGESGADTMGVPDSLVDCANNVMVWLGAGPYPAPLPACFTVTSDRSVWDAAVVAWKSRHGLAP